MVAVLPARKVQAWLLSYWRNKINGIRIWLLSCRPEKSRHGCCPTGAIKSTGSGYGCCPAGPKSPGMVVVLLAQKKKKIIINNIYICIYITKIIFVLSRAQIHS